MRISPRLCTEAELTRFHTPAYVAKIERMSKENGGEAGDFAHFSKVRGDFWLYVEMRRRWFGGVAIWRVRPVLHLTNSTPSITSTPL